MNHLPESLAQDIDDALSLGEPFAVALLPGSFQPQWSGLGKNGSGCSFDVSPWLGRFAARLCIGAEHSATHRSTNYVMPLPDCTTPMKQYLHSIEEASRRCRLRRGKTVISRTICGSLPKDTTPGRLACEFFSVYPNTLRHIYFTPQTGCWLGATPELLLDFDKTTGKFATMAFAGTRKHSETAEWDHKNIGENKFVIDFLHQRFDEVGIKVSFSPLTSVAFGEIEHLCCHISGHATTDMLPQIIDAINPTPALCGYPTADALADINSLEKHPRNCYGGFVAVNNMQLYRAFVNLRCMQLHDGRFCIYTGGGIVADSSPMDEFHETEAKSATLQQILHITPNHSI